MINLIFFHFFHGEFILSQRSILNKLSKVLTHIFNYKHDEDKMCTTLTFGFQSIVNLILSIVSSLKEKIHFKQTQTDLRYYKLLNLDWYWPEFNLYAFDLVHKIYNRMCMRFNRIYKRLPSTWSVFCERKSNLNAWDVCTRFSS